MMQSHPAGTVPKSLFLFSVFYGGMVCIAGVLGNKQVALGPLAVEAGIFAFLLLVVVSSAVAELHGRTTANRLVLYGFIPLLASLLLTLLVLAVPASAKMEPERLGAFEMMMLATPRIWMGGIVAYGISQILNVTIFSALKGQSSGFRTTIRNVDAGTANTYDIDVTEQPGRSRMLWLRSGVAGVLSQIVDTLLFITIAFYGVFPIGELLLGQMIAKVVLSALLVPPLIYLFVALGRRLDVGEAAAAH
jgi:uncharacterized integral membrane protein (TIGR00697 family)